VTGRHHRSEEAARPADAGSHGELPARRVELQERRPLHVQRGRGELDGLGREPLGSRPTERAPAELDGALQVSGAHPRASRVRALSEICQQAARVRRGGEIADRAQQPLHERRCRHGRLMSKAFDHRDDTVVAEDGDGDA
jgi:hypothetical protein